MMIGVAIRGDLRKWAVAVNAAVEKGTRAGLRRTVSGLRNGVRRSIRAAGFKKPGLVRLVSGKVTGKGEDIEGRVRSVARYKAGATRAAPVDLVALFGEGATVTAPGGRWLAIPTGNGPPKPSGRGGNRFATPREMAALGWKIGIAKSGAGKAVGGRERVVTHVLVRQVTLRKRYDLDAVVGRWVPRLPELMAIEINKAADASAELRRIEQ